MGYFVFLTLDGIPATQPELPSGPSGGLNLQADVGNSEAGESDLDRLRERAQAEPRNVGVRIELGEALIGMGDHGSAVTWLESVVEIEERNTAARNLLASAYLELGRSFEAVAAYEAVLSTEPDNARALMGLGRVKLYMLKDIEGGLQLWDRLVARQPDSPQAREVRDELEALRSAHAAPAAPR